MQHKRICLLAHSPLLGSCQHTRTHPRWGAHLLSSRITLTHHDYIMTSLHTSECVYPCTLSYPADLWEWI
jgi:hypothetical protein